MAVTCPECAARFRLSDALCDDWRDPDRALGCPRCGVFLRVEQGPERVGLRSGLLSGFCATPAFMLLGHGYVHADAVVMFLAGLVSVGVFALWYVDGWGRARRFVPSGHRRDVEPTRYRA
ncbi:MAG: hypothetical protein V2J24_20520 [Pseudomonadales bacterium]|jgi:hypothetical protein|nr:hypothetical protein [Pseudomonadales bacterium]